MGKKILMLILVVSLGGTFSFPIKAFEVKDSFPKTANYYLQPNVPQEHYDDLAKYDLLILDVDTQTIDTSLFSQIKNNNPDVKFLAYIPSQSVNTEDLGTWARFRKMTYNQANSNDWWLKDSSGNIISRSSLWPAIKFVDMNDDWNTYLSDLAKNDVMSRNIWDGIFYDMVYANIEWLNNGNIDINQDGQKDDANSINQYWQKQMQNLLNQTQNKINPKIVLINLDKINSYEDNSDGLMMESFPSPHLTNNWAKSIEYYLTQSPLKIAVINANTNNLGTMGSYREMRFGLASTLLGDGYYSFDYGVKGHAQTWWYDEYNTNLGKAKSAPYNLLEIGNQEIKPGLWRRDFEQGITLVNSTNQKQNYIFNNEEFEKINGTQDRRINNGIRTNLIDLEPNDGIILLKTNKEIRNSSFNNGSFVRVFDQQGQQTQNGFFAFKDNLPGQIQVLTTDLDNDGYDETLTSNQGVVSIYENDQKIREFQPYDFKGNIFLSVGDVNNDGIKEIVTGVGLGGGPHVKVLNQTGQTLNEFMAYDERFRGGVSVSVGDVNQDGIDEIVTGTGPTGGPHVKVLNQTGQTLNEFMAYDERFRGGVNISLGDVNNDSFDEIITGAGPTGGPHVKIFNQNKVVLNEFMAYDESNKDGIMVMTDDLDKNGFDEVLVGIINF